MAEKKGLIVITGSSGRIGVAAIRRFASDYDIVGLDKIPPKEGQELYEHMHLDLTSDRSVKETFEKIAQKYGNRITSCLHLAAYYSFLKGSPELYEQITVQGTNRILQALHTFETEQFLFSSTQLVHSPGEVGQKINEKSPVIPKWDYPLSKVRTEKLIQEKRGEIPSVIFRIAGCYNDECRSIPISNQIQRIYEKQFGYQLYPGDIHHGAVFLHFDDLVDAMALAIERRNQIPNNVTLLIGEERTLSYDEMQRTISRLIYGTEFTTYHIPKWMAKLGAWGQNHNPFQNPSFIQPWMIDLADDHYELDVSLAKHVLGWSPKRFVGDALAHMISLLKCDPERFYSINGLVMPKKFAKIEV